MQAKKKRRRSLFENTTQGVAAIDISRRSDRCLVMFPKRRFLKTLIGAGSLCVWSEKRAASFENVSEFSV